ncbi:PREDICTED: uncharacterized protein LOC103334454 [Prunus mume]|uniref:Uncharacterized protein LOC103334454 n=1 Tax=Prunus mume TaxID=102107 RepID=A0ABM0P806_PRUMU|nr:PREDICTED: uncharacterized protein LOC103334454 [Prunus mume]
MISKSLQVLLNMLDSTVEEPNALSCPSDTLPPLMSNLKIEKETDEAPGRQREEEEEGEQDSSEYPDYFLGLSRDIFERSVKKHCDTDEERHRAMKSISRFCALVESGAPRTIEEFEASIPDNPKDWTQEMWEYMYQKEQESMRKFTEQQLALQKQKRIQKRLDKKFHRRRKIVKKTSKREKESSSGLA